MSERRTHPKWHSIEVALERGDVRPRDLGIRELAKLLEAMANLVESVADELGVSRPVLRLEDVREGSARYCLVTPDARRAIDRALAAVKSRGKHAGPGVRRALGRLSESAGENGTVRISVPGRAQHGPVIVQPPVADEDVTYETVRIITGKILGVRIRSKIGTIWIKPRMGAEVELRAGIEIAEGAGPLVNKNVRARVVFTRGPGAGDCGFVESLRRIEPADFLDQIHSLRTELEADGVEVDAARWLAGASRGSMR